MLIIVSFADVYAIAEPCADTLYSTYMRDEDTTQAVMRCRSSRLLYVCRFSLLMPQIPYAATFSALLDYF